MSLEADNLNKTASVRLQKLVHVPDSADLQAALEQSKKASKAVIELPWKTSSSPATYVLKVTSEDGLGEANWVLNKGDTVDAAVLWSFDSNDVSLIESLIAAECDGVRELSVSDQPVNLEETEKSKHKESSRAEADSSRTDLPAGVELDKVAINKVDKLFKDPSTGLVTESFFQYFIKQEYERFSHNGTPFALLMVRIRVDYGDGKIGFLPERAFSEAVKRFKQSLRSIDILAQYQENKIAVILPGGTVNSGIQCVQSLEATLASEPLQPGLDTQQLRFSAGIASIPDTCQTLEVLLAAALSALNQSTQTGSLVVFPSAS